MSFKREIMMMRKFYFEWRGNEKPSPAFQNESIKVTRAGWNHVIDRTRRSRDHILDRIRLLPLAKKILEEMPFAQTYRQEGNREYWSFQGVIENKTIRVIVRSVKQGNKHFYSVFPVIPKIHHRHKKMPLSRLAPHNGVGGVEH